MGWHIVGTLARVNVGSRFRGDPVQRRLHIYLNIRISILVDRQGCRRVLQKDVQQAHGNATQFSSCVQNIMSDQVQAARSGSQRDSILVPWHWKIFPRNG